jgi:predicted dehydrogenase/threonine dehydrogenase-like Zn-dependent dehydrogenase
LKIRRLIVKLKDLALLKKLNIGDRMKQIFQSFSTGKTEIGEVPCPLVKPGHLLIRSGCSVVSVGTERMLVEFGKANLLDKARQQPDRVRQALEKLRTDGLAATVEAVRAKLDKPIPLGYSNAGMVLAIGAGVDGFAVGDRVVSNGPHAEVVCVPKNLCAKIPDGVSDEAAAFTVIGAIGLQGVRLIQPVLGETIVVTGLGLVGLLTVQILAANGCRVLGIDFDREKLVLARELGAETVDLSKGEDPVAVGMAFSGGRGVDGVIITAATESNEPVSQAAHLCRKRGRIVLVGVTGLELSRADFYQKELSFQVSCSYGPGRYDPAYEAGGMDYPFGFVRWTEQRNFQAVLELLAQGRLKVEPLISHRFKFEKALEAYELLCGAGSPLGILLEYPEDEQVKDEALRSRVVTLTGEPVNKVEKPTVALIGAGDFAGRSLLPALKKTGVRLKTIASSGGLSGVYLGRKFGFETTTTDIDMILNDQEIDAVIIATRHDCHADLVCRALEAGKHVFVEKPLALNREQLARIEAVYEAVRKRELSLQLMVGFNRRFAPQVKKMKSLLDGVKAPKSIILTVNAGAVPAEHWVRDPEAGGGRIVGEACHFIDLLRFLVGCQVVDLKVSKLGEVTDESISFTLSFADGSIGTVHYLANGHRAFPKERVEVFGAGLILQLDNFKILRGFGWPGFRKMKLWRQDKGHGDEMREFINVIREGKSSLIAFNELVEVTEISLKIAEL